MTRLGTALRPAATRVMLLGSGELGKEVAIECQRLGVEVIAVDRYANAPAMHVAHRSHVIDMLDGNALRALIADEKPDFVVPEIEAIATEMLVALEQEGQRVVPCATAAKLTMNREGIRRLAAEELQLPTSSYRFAGDKAAFLQAVEEIGYPCIIKPVMSSSGKGQSFIRDSSTLDKAWDYAQQGGRAGAGRVIVEGVVKFDFEITLLTVSAVDGVYFCDPIGHRQEDGDYRESWQPQQMSALALARAQEIARKTVLALGGYGVLLVLCLTGFSGNLVLLCVPGVVVFACNGMLSVLTTLFLSNSVDYGQLKTGRREESVIFSMQTFVVKAASGVAVFLTGIGLDLIGLVGNTEETGPVAAQSASTLLGLRLMMTVLPMVVLVAALVLFRRKFTLSDDHAAEISAQLHGKKEGV